MNPITTEYLQEEISRMEKRSDHMEQLARDLAGDLELAYRRPLGQEDDAFCALLEELIPQLLRSAQAARSRSHHCRNVMEIITHPDTEQMMNLKLLP